MWGKITLVLEVLKFLKGLYETYQDKQIDNHYKKKDERRKRLLSQIDANRNDDAKLIELNRKLTMLNSSK